MQRRLQQKNPAYPQKLFVKVIDSAKAPSRREGEIRFW